MESDVRPWEIELSDEEIDRFELILLDIDGGGRSKICPFPKDDRSIEDCSNCIQLFSDIKNAEVPLRLSCPCDIFPPEVITERIEKLLQYNELMRKQEHEKVNTS
ncbi:hypothetical protein KAU11_00260 [Candidatus Babeliales bacterium]|nr:hypothetical protein [Candidatus Babeliales bacterium]